MPITCNTDLPVSFHPNYFSIISTFIPSLPNSALSTMSPSNNNGDTRQEEALAITTVAQALEVARDSPEGAQDETVKRILETALGEIWGKIQAQPSSFVMTREEFAVFNYFQHRFEGQELAIEARRRYWDHSTLANGQ
jgi:hypothetical protein